MQIDTVYLPCTFYNTYLHFLQNVSVAVNAVGCHKEMQSQVPPPELPSSYRHHKQVYLPPTALAL